MTKWSYIIIGAGSAGCALAHELLQAAPNSKILILEAGGSDRSPFIKVPAGQIRAVTRHDFGYRSQPDPSRNGAVENWFRGRVLGGSSSINGTVYVRGADIDFDRWAHTLGSGAWSAKEVMPIFRELECGEQHGLRRGRSGNLSVRSVKWPHSLSVAFLRSADACGFQLNEDYNGEVQEGVGYAQFSQHRRLRCSAADAFLRPHLGRKNLKLLLTATVHKIEVENGRAVAVCYKHRGETHRETAQDIILCAGAIDSPRLLMLSGIGDPEELQRHKIDVAADLPRVGLNLREHPLLRLTFRSKVPTYNLTGGLRQKIDIARKFVMGQEGPLSNLFEAVAFLKSTPAESNPDIQLHFVPIGYLSGRGGMIELAKFPSVTVLVNKSRPASSGRIRLASSNPSDAPLIECRLLEQQADVDTLVQGIKVVRRIVAAEPLASLIEEEVSPGVSVESASALADHVRRNTTLAFHPVGTCAMGPSSDAVVGPDLQVRGFENLWVGDASVMPDLISGNTNAVCMMIGAKLGRQLAAR